MSLISGLYLLLFFILNELCIFVALLIKNMKLTYEQN